MLAVLFFSSRLSSRQTDNSNCSVKHSAQALFYVSFFPRFDYLFLSSFLRFCSSRPRGDPVKSFSARSLSPLLFFSICHPSFHTLRLRISVHASPASALSTKLPRPCVVPFLRRKDRHLSLLDGLFSLTTSSSFSFLRTVGGPPLSIRTANKMDPDAWTTLVKKAFLAGQELCRERRGSQLDPLHVLQALLQDKQSFAYQVLSQCSGDFSQFQEDVQRSIKKFPQQNPPPDFPSPNHAMLEVFRHAKDIQKSQSRFWERAEEEYARHEDTHVSTHLHLHMHT